MTRNQEPQGPAAPAPGAPAGFDAEFEALVARRRRVTALLLGLLFTAYYGYMLLIPYARELMARRIDSATTLAIAAGVAVIFLAVFLTWAYVGWANQSYDPEVERLRRRLHR